MAMAANKAKWPECGCSERCHMRKCHSVGSRKMAKLGSAIKSAQIGLVMRKYAPERLRLVIKLARELPVEDVIAYEAGMSKSALRYALMGSREGHPGDPFDIKLEDGTTERFHILFEDAVEAGIGKIEQAAWELATGKAKRVLEYQGKVTYKQDRRLVALGHPEDGTYILDENGDRIPETIPIIDPEMIRWLLERRKPEIYGKQATRAPKEPQRQGGVLVVGNPMSREEYERRFGGPRPLTDIEIEGLPPLKN
jgi:hypothetical protein